MHDSHAIWESMSRSEQEAEIIRATNNCPNPQMVGATPTIYDQSIPIVVVKDNRRIENGEK